MRVLAGIDGGPHQADALALASQLAAGPGGSLVVAAVYAVRSRPHQLGTRPEDAQTAAEMALRDARDAVTAGAETRLEGDTSVARGLHRLAGAEHADVIVIGSCHRGALGRVALGSSGAAIVHHAPCAVAVAPRGFADRPSALGSVAVAYDGGAESDAALAWAQALAERAGATLTLLAVVHPPGVPTYSAPGVHGYDEASRLEREGAQMHVDRALGRLPAGLHATARIVEGKVARTLAGEAEGFDLLVCGSRDHGPVGSVLLGGVSRRLMHDAACPLVVLPRSVYADEQPAAAAAEADAGR
jgi:nucleotide-binding universal stress UspA family protein